MRKEIRFEAVLLEGGEFLPHVTVQYSTYGKLNKEKSNVIWVCHALTGDDQVHNWWSPIFGKNQFLDPDKYFIVCANVLGSCYGTTGPTSAILPHGFERRNFPLITIRDIVKLHQRLADYLGLDHIKTLIGPSLGGQQALEWAVSDHQRFENVCVIAANAKHSAWGVAFNESQRMALWSDETFRSNYKDGGKFGLRAARAIALLSYRSYDCYQATQNEEHDFKVDSYRASSYQNYQGDKIVKRFSPYSYWTLSKAMDSQNIGRDRGGVRKALSNLPVKLLTIGISTDVLFPPNEQEEIAEFAKNGIFRRIDSIYGHDGFLIEGEQLNKILFDLHEERLRPATYTKLKSNYLN